MYLRRTDNWFTNTLYTVSTHIFFLLCKRQQDCILAFHIHIFFCVITLISAFHLLDWFVYECFLVSPFCYLFSPFLLLFSFCIFFFWISTCALSVCVDLNLQSHLWTGAVHCLRDVPTHYAPTARLVAVQCQWWKWHQSPSSLGHASSSTLGSSTCFLSERQHHYGRYEQHDQRKSQYIYMPGSFFKNVDIHVHMTLYFYPF